MYRHNAIMKGNRTGGEEERQEEFPDKDTLSYILEVPPAVETGPAAEKKAGSDISVIFCVDVSGSMDSSKQTAEKKMMKYARRPGSVTRLEALKIAIDSQIQTMTRDTPNAKVGFVTFESNVILIGDGTRPHHKFESSEINDFYPLSLSLPDIM